MSRVGAASDAIDPFKLSAAVALATDLRVDSSTTRQARGFRGLQRATPTYTVHARAREVCRRFSALTVQLTAGCRTQARRVASRTSKRRIEKPFSDSLKKYPILTACDPPNLAVTQTKCELHRVKPEHPAQRLP